MKAAAVRVDTRYVDGCVVLALAGRLDFHAYRVLKAAYEPPLASPAIAEVLVDLAGVDSLDSSALGLLLILRERSLAANKRVSLVNGRGSVAAALDAAQFPKLFEVW